MSLVADSKSSRLSSAFNALDWPAVFHNSSSCYSSSYGNEKRASFLMGRRLKEYGLFLAPVEILSQVFNGLFKFFHLQDSESPEVMVRIRHLASSMLPSIFLAFGYKLRVS